MEDASVELIQAMMAAMLANADLVAYVGIDGIYDRVPTDEITGNVIAQYPYISLGPTTIIPSDYDCMYGEEITIQWDVWTSGSNEAYGTAQCRKITNLVKRTLHDVELALTNNALVTLQLEIARILDDPNPAIGHGVVQFTAVVDTP